MGLLCQLNYYLIVDKAVVIHRKKYIQLHNFKEIVENGQRMYMNENPARQFSHQGGAT